MRFLTIIVIAVTVTSLFGCSSGNGGIPDSDDVLDDIQSRLSSAKDWEDVELVGEWQFTHEKTMTTGLPDTAKRTFTAETEKGDDGAWMSYKGLAIYRRSGPESWVFNRLFFFENSTTYHSTSKPSAAELVAVVEKSLREHANSTAWRTFELGKIAHIYSINVPNENSFTQNAADQASFDAVIEYDKILRKKIARERVNIQIKANQDKGGWNIWLVQTKGGRKQISEDTRNIDYNKVPRLTTATFDSLYGPNLKAERPILVTITKPTKKQIQEAFKKTVDFNINNYKGILGDNIAQRLVGFEKLTTDMTTLRRIDPSTFNVRTTLTYQWKSLDNNLIISMQKYYLTVKGHQDSYYISQSKLQGDSKEITKLDIIKEEVTKIPLMIETLKK